MAHLAHGQRMVLGSPVLSVLFHSAHPQMGPHPISRFVQLEGVQKGPLDRWYTSGLRRRPSQRALLGEKVLVVYT